MLHLGRNSATFRDMETTHKPNFDEAVEFLVATHGSLNKAAKALGLSPSGFKYQTGAGLSPRKRSAHTRDWICSKAAEAGWRRSEVNG